MPYVGALRGLFYFDGWHDPQYQDLLRRMNLPEN